MSTCKFARCVGCKEVFTIDELWDLTHEWEKQSNLPQEHLCNTLEEMLYRECHKCGSVGFELVEKVLGVYVKYYENTKPIRRYYYGKRIEQHRDKTGFAVSKPKVRSMVGQQRFG